jgi:hypothetical protein
MTDAWEREVALARTTAVWGVASVLGGLGFARRFRGDPWRRAFGLQNAGWGAVDLAVVVVAETRRRRRMARLADPREPAELREEGRRLRRILLVNVGLDAGYVVGGLALWRWRRTGAAAGASAGIVAQGTFLLAHDAHHAYHGR